MFKRLLFLIILIIGLFYFNNSSLAYDDQTTHPALTDEIVDFYNFSFSDKQLTPQQKEWVVQGSILEDEPPRWINHFLDPISNQGWTGEKTGAVSPATIKTLSFIFLSPENALSAVEWTKNSLIQQQYSRYGGNRTWKKALEYYADANYEEAYKTLGYVLHLLEDMSVPEHTRNDTHAPEFEQVTGDYGSPYEEYLKKYNRQSIKELNIVSDLKNKNAAPVAKSSIEDYLISLAQYSNKYFFSKDTTDDLKYQNPKIIRDDGSFGYGIDENNKKFWLARTKTEIDSVNGKAISKYYLPQNDKDFGYSIILDAYFSRLSRQAALHGAGVIDLFRKQAADEIVRKEYPARLVEYDFSEIKIPGITMSISLFGEGVKFWNAARSFFAQISSTAQNSVSAMSNFFTGIFNNDQGLQLAGQITLPNADLRGSDTEQRGADADINQANTKLNQSLATNPPQQTSNQQTQSPQNQSKKINTQYPVKNPNKPLQEDDENEEENALQRQDDSALNKPQTEPNQDEPALNYPLITSKQCSFATTQSSSRQNPAAEQSRYGAGIIINEIAWMGTTISANDEWIELKNISGATVDITSWQLIDKDEKIKINLGLLKKTEVAAGGLLLLERTDDNSVPGITANLIYSGALSNSNEGLRLFDNNCNLIDEILTASDWPAGNNTEKKTMERDANNFSWHTSSVVNGTPKAENSSPAQTQISYGGGGGASTGGSNNQQSSLIIISEIMYDLSGSDTGREWVEIFNNGNTAVDLTNWKFYENQTNHGLTLIQGSANLSAGGYAIIADDPNQFLVDNPGFSGTILKSSFSLNNTGETLALKNDDLIIDEVSYSSDWSANGDGKSLQKINGNWTASLPTPGQQNQLSQSNQAPSAFFVYGPQGPTASDLITFNAASSSDPDGTISLYQWDFGDNTTTSTALAAITYSYPQAGNYTASLIVFDNQNASSTATSTIISVVAPVPQLSPANHIVISEIFFNATGSDTGKEFIELYNPTANDISIDNWSLRILSGSATSTASLIKFGSQPEDVALIKGKSFLLAGFNNYSGTPAADAVRSASLPNSSSAIYLLDNNDNEIDSASYDDTTAEGQSIERKAISNNFCVAAQNENEFLGNGCDNDNTATDFSVRSTPNPQNSSSFPEPRNAPTIPSNFSIQYSSSTMQINFTWQPSQDYSGVTSSITYKINDISNASSTLPVITTTSTSASAAVNEISRNYQFSLQAIDRDGLGSATTTASISVPSLISSLYFYQDPRSGSADYLIETYYNQYPFVPNLYNMSGWRILVFYLNSEPVGEDMIYTSPGPVWQPSDLTNVLKTKYKQCSGGMVSPKYALIMPQLSSDCGTGGGIMNAAFDFGQLEDNHFLISSASSTNDIAFTSNDYLTIAYYALYQSWGNQSFKLVATDKTKYYFQPSFSQASVHQPPTVPQNLTSSLDSNNSNVIVGWDNSSDTDTLDNLIKYELNYMLSSEAFDESQWQETYKSYQSSADENGNPILIQTGPAISVNPGNQYKIYLRAKDDFNNYSSSTFINYTAPSISPPFGLSNIKWGYINSSSSVGLSFDYNNYSSLVSADMVGFVFYLNNYAPGKGLETIENTISDGLNKLQVNHQGCAGNITKDYLILPSTGILNDCRIQWMPSPITHSYNFNNGSIPSSGTITATITNGPFNNSDYITLLIVRRSLSGGSGYYFEQQGRYLTPIQSQNSP